MGPAGVVRTIRGEVTNSTDVRAAFSGEYFLMTPRAAIARPKRATLNMNVVTPHPYRPVATHMIGWLFSLAPFDGGKYLLLFGRRTAQIKALGGGEAVNWFATTSFVLDRGGWMAAVSRRLPSTRPRSRGQKRGLLGFLPDDPFAPAYPPRSSCAIISSLD